jgi:WD40 repeat protein
MRMTKRPASLGSILWLVFGLVAVGAAYSSSSAESASEATEHTHEEDGGDSHLSDELAGLGIFITHIHGIGYTADGQRLLVASHDGLKVRESGSWSAADAPHDFMGFTAVEGGFFSSGHPSPASGLPNPLGLVFVDDHDWEVTGLGFQGDLDFHLMAAGYASRTIYLVNTQNTPTLPAGLFVSTDGAASWTQQPAAGLRGQIGQLAVHPVDSLISAYASSGGLYVSVDGGRSAVLWVDRADVYALTFSPDGSRIYFGGNGLEYRDVSGDTGRLGFGESEEIITHITVNPANPDEITVATASMSVFTSDDGGSTWEPILIDGRGL